MAYIFPEKSLGSVLAIGQLHGFAGGLDAKRFLLAMEGRRESVTA
ncbi:hypothetical protein [Pararhizobium sp. LjRoot238]